MTPDDIKNLRALLDAAMSDESTKETGEALNRLLNQHADDLLAEVERVESTEAEVVELKRHIGLCKDENQRLRTNLLTSEAQAKVCCDKYTTSEVWWKSQVDAFRKVADTLAARKRKVKRHNDQAQRPGHSSGSDCK